MKPPSFSQGLPVDKKTLLTATFNRLLFLAMITIFQVITVEANPYTHIFPIYSGEVNPRSDTQPPRITILSPEHNSTFNMTSLSISFKAEVGESKSAENKMISNVYYKADWLENKTYVYEYVPTDLLVYEDESDFSATLNLTGIPEGRHSVIVYATERGTYYDPPFSEWPMWALEFSVKSYGFQIIGASTIFFTIDVTPLNVTVLSVTSHILSESGVSDVPLNFIINGLASKISYALDGQTNVTIVGNTTLSDLPYGLHSVIVYVWDAAGNVGTSETVTFTVEKPFPTTFAVAVSGSSVGVLAVGLLFYFRKRKR